MNMGQARQVYRYTHLLSALPLKSKQPKAGK